MLKLLQMWQGNSAMEAVRVPKCAMTCESTTYQIGQVEDELMVFYGFLWFSMVCKF